MNYEIGFSCIPRAWSLFCLIGIYVKPVFSNYSFKNLVLWLSLF